MLLHEFDPSPHAVIDPEMVTVPVPGMPKVSVSCFSRITFARMVEAFGGMQIAETRCAGAVFPIYRVTVDGADIALMMTGVGAPLCVGGLEELFQMGVETAIVFGNCGVLDRSIEDCGIILPTAALRDEGTSYHYAPPGDEIAVNPRYMDVAEGLMQELGVRYTLGKCWTTDAIYRETRGKAERRKAAGAVCVDMECSALAALAQFRGKEVFQFFYAGDNLDAEQWDKRSLSATARVDEKDRIAELAMTLAVRIHRAKEASRSK